MCQKASVEHIFPVQEMREGYLALELYVDPAELRGDRWPFFGVGAYPAISKRIHVGTALPFRLRKAELHHMLIRMGF